MEVVPTPSSEDFTAFVVLLPPALEELPDEPLDPEPLDPADDELLDPATVLDPELLHPDPLPPADGPQPDEELLHAAEDSTAELLLSTEVLPPGRELL